MGGRTHAERVAPPAYLASRGTAWHNPRTAIILAHGATQNWPTVAEDKIIRKEHAKLTEARRREAREAADRRALAMYKAVMDE